MTRTGGAIIGIGLLAVLGTVVLVSQIGLDIGRLTDRFSQSPVNDALRQENPPAFSEIDSDVRPGVLTVVGEQPLPASLITVAVDPPDGATMMQFSADPSFFEVAWEPVIDRVEVRGGGIGYQMIYARFKFDDDTIGSTSVVGAHVDPTWEAATSSASGPHQPSWIRPLSATELVIRFEAGRVRAGSLEPYDLQSPVSGDEIDTVRGLKRVKRNGDVLGMQVSARSDVIRRPDRLLGQPLDLDRLLNEDWRIESTDDDAYSAGMAPVSVRHITRPSDGGHDQDGRRIWALVHDVIITLPNSVKPGSTYEVRAPGAAPGVLEFDPDSVVSPAIRTNQVGFSPADQSKVAFLSGWFDGIGDTALTVSDPTFRVFNTTTGDEVFEGTGTARPATGDEGGFGDLTGSAVVELDFSPLDELGRYRLCVEMVGCSHDFEIANDVWSRLTTTVARSVYHQRSGAELGQPYTSFARPRGFHPDDGVVVSASDYSLLQAQTETANTDFERLADLRTDQVVDGAWGGHFDAGDWDRRIQHLWFARAAAQLVLLYPERYASLPLSIPESGDEVPDLLDEALWTVELFQRMQREDGAIRGGIESSEHPPVNATSWVDDLAVFAYDPDPYSTYLYAGVAAEFSVALQPYDSIRADALLESSRRAMAWAEQNRQIGDYAEAEMTEPIEQQRSVASAALLMATGEREWHELFVTASAFLESPDPSMSCHAHYQCDAAWLYLQADESVTDPVLRQKLLDRFLASADSLVDLGQQTAYGWTLENPGVPLIWGLGVGGGPKGSGLMRAYVLSGDEKYRSAAISTSSVSLGANPLGRSMLTGVGSDPVLHPQINDVKHGGIPAWPGTPVYGFHYLNSRADEQWIVDDLLGPAGVSPAPTDLPYLWQWYDIDSVAQYNEFTIHQSHGEALFVFGLLAATD